MKRIDELSELLGSISTDLKHIRSRVDAIDCKVEKVGEETIRHGMMFKNIDGRVTTAERLLTKHEQSFQRSVGMKQLAGFIWAVIGGIITTLGSIWLK